MMKPKSTKSGIISRSVLLQSSAASDTLGYRKSAKEEWITLDTWTLILERKKIRSKILDCKNNTEMKSLSKSYREKDKEVKRSERRDK